MPTSAAFFFGSGISLASKAPTVDELTNNLLTSAWKLHTDSRFYACKPEDGPASIGTAKRAQDFLALIKAEIDPHLRLRDNRTANYEDLYAAVLQIFQDETFEIVTPLIARSVAEIKAKSRPLHFGEEDYVDDNPFATLADQAINLIQWVVYRRLARVSAPIGMGTISDVAAALDRVDVFSLNHDLLIEAQLASARIPFSDGFTKARGDLREWNPDWDNLAQKVNLFKLHGSTNWYLCGFENRNYGQYAAIDKTPDYARDETGAFINLIDAKPMFLTGTTVKEQAYGLSLVGDLFFKFREVLSRHRSLIVCGYGWNDKGINNRLAQWLHDSPANRMFILHAGHVDELRAKRFWHFQWDDLVKANKVSVIPSWLNGTSVDDLEKAGAF